MCWQKIKTVAWYYNNFILKEKSQEKQIILSSEINLAVSTEVRKKLVTPFTCRNICRTSEVEKNSFLAFMAFALSSKVPSKWTGNNKYASWFRDPPGVGYQ